MVRSSAEGGRTDMLQPGIYQASDFVVYGIQEAHAETSFYHFFPYPMADQQDVGEARVRLGKKTPPTHLCDCQMISPECFITLYLLPRNALIVGLLENGLLSDHPCDPKLRHVFVDEVPLDAIPLGIGSFENEDHSFLSECYRH